MTDSTLNGTAAYNKRLDAALSQRPLTVSASDFFKDALREYMTTGALLDDLETRESPLRPALDTVHQSARNLVIAAADYHCARRVFEAQKALIELDRTEEA